MAIIRHTTHFVAKGDFAIRQGEAGNTAYLIQFGQVRVFAEHAGKVAELGRLEAGDIFGEMALVVEQPRTASVQALEDTNLVVITRPMMIERLAKTDPLIKALMPMLMKRIKDANDAALSRSQNFKDLVNAANDVYRSIEMLLEPQQKEKLESAVKPKLDEFIRTVEDFKKLHEA